MSGHKKYFKTYTRSTAHGGDSNTELGMMDGPLPTVFYTLPYIVFSK